MTDDVEDYISTVDMILDITEDMPLDKMQFLIKTLQHKMLQKLMEEEDR